ncbi:hypothetical protein ETZ92_004350 [Bacillus velezensis]|uniref:hypothetical protein n=1 Tax=Bacillus velezensis TaxID=492670 RepID=UPI000B4CDD7C|nr:hypothetical protein [Bacillus velezensis]OWP57667.1 hypothetical protein CEA92_15255 [Bacillus velezensis]QEQ03530.1 hypothetical protein ETZ92_004350 [Bacillus velezensis]
MFNKKVLKHNLTEMNYKELVKFIKHEFPNDGQDYHTHVRKVQIIKSLSPSELSSAIARMERIKSLCDPSKTWGIGSLILGTSFIGFQVLFGVNLSKITEENQLNALIYVLITIIICLWTLRNILKDKENATTADYFKELLIQIKSEKKQ